MQIPLDSHLRKNLCNYVLSLDIKRATLDLNTQFLEQAIRFFVRYFYTPN